MLEPDTSQNDASRSNLLTPSGVVSLAADAFPGDGLPRDELPCADDARTTLGRHLPAVLPALSALGIEGGVDQEFRCVLPGHGDGHRATVLRDPKTGLFKYRDAAARRGTRHRWLRLAHVRASVAYGYTRTLSGAEAALWYVKLWEETGVLPMPRLAYAPLFTRLEGDLEIVARAFAEVVGVRWCASPGVPVALTRPFVGAW